jgi:hypothetical protein
MLPLCSPTQLGDIWVQWLDLAKPEIAEPILWDFL